jgi:GNAT superfamily N-acetyltransferase
VDAASIEIRAATSADARLLSELGSRTFSDTFAADNNESDMIAYLANAFGVDIQTRELADPSSTFLIAQVAGTAAGYSRLRFGPAPECVRGVRPVEIARFYADAPWIGRGVGAALLMACLDEAAARSCDVVWLATWDRNARAIAFYSKWGFEAAGEADFALGDDVQHDLLMVRAAG